MRQWIALGAASALVAALVPLVQHRASAEDALSRTTAQAPASARPITPPPLTGVDLLKLKIDETEVTAPASPGRVAHLSLDPVLQREVQRILKAHKLPEAAVVVTDTS